MRTLALFLASSCLVAPVTSRAQVDASRLDPAAVATLDEGELRRAATARFRDRALDPDGLRPAWVGFEQGSFDAFLAGDPTYTKVFVAQDGSAAAVVTYARGVVDGAPTVTAELELRTRAGGAIARFDVTPHLEFSVAPDGDGVVGHGEHMAVALTDGVLHTSLAFYDRAGSLRREVRSMEFSPTHTSAIFPAEGVFALAVLGRVIAFDLESGGERWRLALERPGDLPFLAGAPDGRRAALTVLGENGATSVLLLDGSGARRGRFVLEGRTLPGDGVTFDASGRVLLVQDLAGDAMDVHFLDGENLRRLRTLREGGGSER